MSTVRVLVNGEDFGTMSLGAAAKLKQAAEKVDPRDVITIEPEPPEPRPAVIAQEETAAV